MSHLSVAKRGFKTKNYRVEIVNRILHKLKTGISGAWEGSWLYILRKNKTKLDLSASFIDRSHIKTLRDGEEVLFRLVK